jgi:glycerol-1-phosphate dehydrogenase [NAD(P)+]
MTIPTWIGKDVLPDLIRCCEEQQRDRFTLVADRNTYRVLGQTIEAALRNHGFAVHAIVLQDEAVTPDEQSIMQVLVGTDRDNRTYLAVGSGTITDIVRFCSHRTKADFISLPTAPSVDGYTAPGASLVIHRLKQTVSAQPPMAIFADLPTLCAAPRPMIAAGFGDILGKYTSLADWRLGHLLWQEPYDEGVAQRVEKALTSCVGNVEAIGQAAEAGIRELMLGLLETGSCMLAAGHSRPAAGAEHYVSHYLEMMLLWEDRPAILHGAKVGLATLHVARHFDRLRRITRQEAIERLRASSLPDRARDVETILAAYGPIGQDIVEGQRPFLDMTPDGYANLKQAILDHWDEIQAIAASVPSPEMIERLLRTVGGAVEAPALGLSEAELAHAFEVSHYLRNRFTVLKLDRMLGA